MIRSVVNETVRLSKSCTVSQYRQYVDRRDVEAIAAFLIQRFEERYLDPVTADTRTKNGFTIIAVSCLMIEAIESFRLGWVDSRGKSKRAFSSFFSRWDQFSLFRSDSDEFYEHVRCGVLHQAETTGGWCIVRKGPLRSERTINATRFAAALKDVLHDYAAQLKRSDWESEMFVLFRQKMAGICANAER